jgi:hypothetical protein
MRWLASRCLPFVLLVGACLPEPKEAAVRVDVTYTFKAGCITVLARDAESSAREASTALEVLDRGPSTVTLAVFRQATWSHTLEITTSAHERSCQGPVVAQQVHTVELRKPRIEPLAVTLSAEDSDGDTYIATSSGGTDCDDSRDTIHPGHSELCDGLDNDCDGLTDEEGGTRWYPDQDGDGFGDREATPLVSCTKPTGPPSYVADNTDCRDSDPAAFPRPDTAETLCNDVDDDCDGVVDDGFPAKGTACSQPCPGGTYVCNATYTGLACGNAPTPIPVFPDEDGDGAGKEGAPSSGAICPGTPPPAGTAANADDCDDLDPHNRRGRAEVCDARDNTCNGQVDEGDVCEGKGWKVLSDPALTGNRQWKTVALGASGLPVWVAGTGGKLAVRRTAGQPFISLDGACGNYNWISAWVHPANGTVFLGSDGGRVAQHDGNACANEAATNVSSPIHGLIGFASPAPASLYLVNHAGRLYTWTPGNTPQERLNQNPESYADIHGWDASLLLGVGGTDSGDLVPTASSYPGTGSTVQDHTLQGVPSGYNGSLRAVWMGGPKLAYAVGDGGLVMKWDGTATWARVAPPSSNAGANFTSVVVLDSSSIYTTDLTGAIRRLSASGWVTAPLYTAGQPLRDIAATAHDNLWAVGDSGTVVHFPE